MAKEFEEYDELFAQVGSILAEGDKTHTVVNENKIKDVKRAYGLLKDAIRGDGVDVSYDLHVPFKTFGHVQAMGKRLEITDTSAFVECGRLADNYELYARTDGKVLMSFSFSGLTTRG